ncbi:MAG: hypothetical protein INH41_18790 [Myxococcaceae bacterium]|jgi:hypothetical protein|nr:hypothetical protein [Myxococcaceae bacterium]MCA3014435.1 hypothetical protein [Myxococcaceae bacterium]
MHVEQLPVSAAEAFRAFTDVGQQRRWVPGVKKVKVVRTDERGRALEVFYEFGETLAYALVFHWDDAALKARWVPSSGVRDGVSGSASFVATASGCELHYHLEALKGRPEGHEREVVVAFAGWLSQQRRAGEAPVER